MNTLSSFSGFPKEGLNFLSELAANNNREWFKIHEEDYHRYILEPAQGFVISLGERLKEISKGIAYDSQTNGSGSIMRIHRDIRFSKDKSPYNTHLRLIFWEGPLKRSENPGFFFSMNSEEGILYAGMHMFPKEYLEKYRAAVLDRLTGKQLEEAIGLVRQAKEYEVGGEYYKRVPAGYPSEHERAGLLLFNGLFTISPKIEKTTLTSPELVQVCLEHSRKMAPIHRWLVQLYES
jgi:uncharacterized protein (TIGR02453 family)